MSIDWFTVAAQIVNFLVLVALLRRFLYGPIVRAMEQREEELAERQRQAEAKLAESERLAQRHEHELETLMRDREQRISAARDDAERERSRLLAESRDAIQRRRAEWLEGFGRERHDLLQQLQQDAGHAALHVARRALEHLADDGLEDRLIHVFQSQLDRIPQSRRDPIVRSMHDGVDPVTVRTAFEVTDARADQIRRVLQQSLNYTGRLHLEQDTNLICGMELETGGYRIGWNIRDYLQSTDERFQREVQKASEGVAS